MSLKWLQPIFEYFFFTSCKQPIANSSSVIAGFPFSAGSVFLPYVFCIIGAGMAWHGMAWHGRVERTGLVGPMGWDGCMMDG